MEALSAKLGDRAIKSEQGLRNTVEEQGDKTKQLA